MAQRSLELKVGILVLAAIALLVGFVAVMGGLSFSPTFTVNVDFDNPGGLKPGAPVRISGVKIGKVKAVEFRGGKPIATTGDREPLVRVITELDDEYRGTLFQNSRWFVTTQAVLGELHLAVEPGTPDRPALQDGAVVQGISPPRLDLLLSEAYELLHYAFVGVSENREKLGKTFDALHRTLEGTASFFERNGDKLDRAADNALALSEDARETLTLVREKYVDNPQIARILDNTEVASRSARENLGPLLADGRKLAGDASKLTQALASDEQLESYRRITRDFGDAASRAKTVARDAETVMAQVKRGDGTVGALVMDEAVYDDLQELLRDLKHNPWKLFWKD